MRGVLRVSDSVEMASHPVGRAYDLAYMHRLYSRVQLLLVDEHGEARRSGCVALDMTRWTNLEIWA